MTSAATAKLDRAGRPARTDYRTGFHAANRGVKQPPNPPHGDRILRAVETLGDTRQDLRLAAFVALLWRGGLTVAEALALHVEDFDGGSVTVRARRAVARRRVPIDAWGAERVARWATVRRELPPGPLLCVLRGPTVGQNWSVASARAEVKRLTGTTPRQLRYAHAAELLALGVSVEDAYRQLGLSAARNNRAPALVGLGKRAVALKPPQAEKILQRDRQTPPGEAYALVRRTLQATDDAHRHAATRAARRAWSDALRALHEAEEKIMLATVEDNAR